MMSHSETALDTVGPLDAATAAIVRLAAAVAIREDAELRPFLTEAARRAPAEWVEEVILQSYLFVGFPRALNAMREWRRATGRLAPDADEGEDFARVDAWASRGEETCSAVYGPFYERLRRNIRALHPALDAWMIVEGYGKVLSRPGLDLKRRELCIVVACAAARQERQLHSHLHGALHVGASVPEVSAALDVVADLLPEGDQARVSQLWARVIPANQALAGEASTSSGRRSDVH
jgi:4-carboxymuconolactone decarboxylase